MADTTIRTEHRVTFYSPGTFVAKDRTEGIASWDRELACAMAMAIVERHGARPYGFRFSTWRIVEVPDGEGTIMGERQVEQSGLHWLGGSVLTLEEVEARDGKDSTLALNMRANHWPAVVENINSYRWTLPFTAGDCIDEPLRQGIHLARPRRSRHPRGSP